MKMKVRAQQSFAQKVKVIVESDEITVRRRPDGITVIERAGRHDLPLFVHDDGYIEQADTAYRRGEHADVVELETIDVSDIDGVERI